MATDNKHLYNLSELSDYKISDGYPDVRNWEVRDINNRVIGKVENLLVNKEAERVVYLDVEVDKSIIDANHDPYARPTNDNIREFINKEGDNHLIIPIGLVELNEDSKHVFTNTINHQTFANTKRFHKGDVVDRSYEVQVLDSYENKHSDISNVKPSTSNPNYIKMDNEDRIREIVREEIRKYHNHDRNDSDWNDVSNDEIELDRRRRNSLTDDDDLFYERREFDDKQFRKRTPGL